MTRFLLHTHTHTHPLLNTRLLVLFSLFLAPPLFSVLSLSLSVGDEGDLAATSLCL